MKMKKLLFLSAASSIHTIKWVNALSKKYEVHLVYCKNHKPKLESISNNIILHELKYATPHGYYLNAYTLNKLYKDINPDIINVHYASGYGTLARIAKLPNIILNVWGSDVYDFPNESKIKRIILKKNIFYANKIASTSNVMANEVYRQFPDLKKKIYITPFGVDTKKFSKKKVSKNSHEFIIGNIKALLPKYGIDYLILGISDLVSKLKTEKKEYKNIKVYIYGEGSQRPELEELVKTCHLENIIFFKGKIPNDEVPFALSQMDVFCATSIINSESFGVAVVEAMSCEVPVIATNIDGFSEVMDSDNTGIIIEKKNHYEIARALEYMIDNKDKRLQFGKAGRKRVLKYFNWDDNVNSMIDVYENK